MKRFGTSLAALFVCTFLAIKSPAQSPAPTGEISDAADLLSLSKKIDEQNTKIDALSQQILRLQQEIEQPKATSLTGPTSSVAGTVSPAPAPAPTGSTHVVARGETLTSIAKLHKVGIEELQKFNHIENDRKLQIGQTLVIPGAQTAAPSSSPSPTAPNE